MAAVLTRSRLVAPALAALLAAGAAAFAQTSAEPQSTSPVPAAEATIHAFGERDKLCAAWTDECRICRRNGAEIACSNISIACQPKDIRCTSRTGGQAQ